MANYVKITDFASKDALATGNPLKLIKGTEINDELNAIQTAVATKADLASPAFTGNPTATTQATGNSTTRLATTAFVNNQIAANASNVTITGGTIAGVAIAGVAITGGAISGLSSFAAPSGATGVTPPVGDNTTKLATTEFVNAEITNDIGNSFTGSNQSLSANGYQKFPGGLIMQWGTFTSPSPGSAGQSLTTNITFPIAFPSAVVSIQQSFYTLLADGSNPASITATSTTGFTAQFVDAYGKNVYWFAIGY